MKNIFILLILTSAACTSQIDKQPQGSLNETSIRAINNTNHEIKDTLTTSGDREYIDSANFHIIRGKYISGAKYIEIYENKLTKLDHWKEFYENGQLKEEGFMTNANHFYVGKWKYYSITGKIDSIIDYDKKYSVSYFQALKIAEKKGYKMSEIEIALNMTNNNSYWEVTRWTENEKHNGQTAEVILIDTKSGKVTKPKYQIFSIN